MFFGKQHLIEVIKFVEKQNITAFTMPPTVGTVMENGSGSTKFYFVASGNDTQGVIGLFAYRHPRIAFVKKTYIPHGFSADGKVASR